MIRSMTGYGFSKKENGGSFVQVEIKSLNSKFLDLSLKTIPLNPVQDLWIRSECNLGIVKGKVSVSILLEDRENKPSKAKTQLDLELLNQLIENLSPLLGPDPKTRESLILTCLSLPGILKNSEESLDETTWSEIQEVFKKAMEEFNNFRDREGKVIGEDLKFRVEQILVQLERIKEMAPQRIILIRERLEESLNELKSKMEIDQNRLEQELIYFIDKLDFTEEITRLETHAQYFISCMNEKEFNGKKLGFICQEMGREINTLGSKANDASIQQRVVSMKEELEKMKEQMANII